MGDRQEAKEGCRLPAGAGRRRWRPAVDALFNFHVHRSTVAVGIASVKRPGSWRSPPGEPKISQPTPETT